MELLTALRCLWRRRGTDRLAKARFNPDSYLPGSRWWNAVRRLATWRACGLIAVSWFLLTPPSAGTDGVDTTAPMSEWNKAGVYQSQDECRQAMRAFTAVIAGKSATRVPPQTILAIEHSECVASDDFRLVSSQQPSAQATR